MAGTSDIEWTDLTWNPVTGCTKISQGCKHCYAERMAKRLRAMGVDRYRNGFKPTLHPDLLGEPLRWRGSKRVFVNSMSDLFHKEVPLEFIQEVFHSIAAASGHSFQILTKRSGRLLQIAGKLEWPSNLWMGVSVEHMRTVERIDHLRQVPAATRFLSCEPLIGPLEGLNLSGIHWMIVGGESGPHARPMDSSWVQSLLAQCRAAEIPFFFKQWGGVRKKATGRVLNGQTYDEFPRVASHSSFQPRVYAA
jgi:protein gp37